MNYLPSRRFLGGGGASNSSSPPFTFDVTLPDNVENLIILLASFLFALICIIGLARCAWFRRSFISADSPPPIGNRGLKKKVIDSLPKLVFSPSAPASAAAGKLTECAICITEFVAGDEIRALPPCGHGFHVDCIDKWFGSHSSCPSCRRILVVRSEKCCELPPPVSENCGGAAGETRIPMNGFLP